MPKLLFLTLSPIESASERYRVYQFLPYLRQAGFECTVRPFANRPLHKAIQNGKLLPKLLLTPVSYLRKLFELPGVSRYDAVIVHRGIFPFPWPAVETAVFRRSGRVLFDFDDAIHVGHRDTSKAKYPLLYKLKYGPGINPMLQSAACVIAGNCNLADHAQQFNSCVSIIPTVVDLDQYIYRPPREDDAPLTIGWVGSRSTSPYLLEIEPALKRIAETFCGKVQFRLYGHPQRQLNLPDFQSLPFSLQTEMQDLRSIDIGIMPMPDNEWTRGKCAFKSIQYMATGIPTVNSPVGMVTDLVHSGQNGFCARTPDDWFTALSKLIESPVLRRQFSIEGRKTIEARYSLQVWAPRLAALIEKVLAGQTSAMPSHAATAVG